MLPLDSYREVLMEHARSRHIVASAWIVAIVLVVLLVIFA
jgi:hypothetical protein